MYLDLDETLISTAGDSTKNLDKIKIKLRPYLNDFLENMSQYYNLIVFTAASWDYAKKVVEKIDPYKKYIKHVFHRENCVCTKDFKFIKD